MNVQENTENHEGNIQVLDYDYNQVAFYHIGLSNGYENVTFERRRQVDCQAYPFAERTTDKGKKVLQPTDKEGEGRTEKKLVNFLVDITKRFDLSHLFPISRLYG